MAKIKPVIVLALICTLICALLIVTYNLTYVDTSGVITDSLRAACEKIDGSADFALITDREAAGLSAKEYDSVIKIVRNRDSGTFLFEVVADGYASGGIDVVVSVNDDGVRGISVVALAETPGLGTRIDDDEFFGRFKGAEDSVIISKNPQGNNEIAGITGATYSSKGLAKAVNAALCAYKALNKDVMPPESTAQ